MERHGLKITVAFLIVTLLFGSCASTTVLRSDPSGAKVYLNEEPVGTTPYSHTDTKIVGTRTEVRLEKEGYKPFTTTLVRNEEVNVGAIIGTILVLIPALWIMDYKPVHTFELESESGNDRLTKPSMESESGALSASQIQRLRELKKLQEDGIITEKEFEEQKARILSER